MVKSKKFKATDRSGSSPLSDKSKHDFYLSSKFDVKENWGSVVESHVLYFWAVAVILGNLAVYLKTMHPSLPGGDSGELIVAAHEYGVGHPPGYPTFTLLSQIFMTLCPLGSVAWRVNLLSVVCGSLCTGMLFFTIYRLCGSVGAGLFGSCMFAFSRLVWTWSICAEVFALNNLLLALLLLTAAMFDSCQKASVTKVCLFGAFLCGLCLTNQHTSVMYIFVIAVWVLLKLWANHELTLSLMFSIGLCFLVGLLPYVYLPISSLMNVARWTWGDQSTISGLIIHLLRREYGTLDLLKDHTGQGFLSGLTAFLYHAWIDLTPAVCVFMMMSLITTYFRYKRGNSVRLLVVFYIMLLLYLAFFCWRANLDINKPLFYKVVERFWLQADLLICVLSAVSFGDFLSWLPKHKGREKLGVALAVLTIAFQVNKWWSVCDQSGNWVVHDFARQTLAAFPKDSIVLTKGDLPSNSLRYFHLCENVRPDLTIFDQEVLTYQWSLPMTRKFYPRLTFPGDQWKPFSGRMSDGHIAFTFKDLIDANYKRQKIFACIGVQEHEHSWQTEYTLWPFGVCWQVVSQQEIFNIDRWIKITEKLGQDWKHELQQTDDGSWEHVASAEMWRAKTATAYFLLELAMEPSSGNHTTELLLKSYEIYNRELSKQIQSPAYWHRNFAIICEKLSRLDVPLDTKDLIKKTVQHFQQFLILDPNDPDNDKIQQAITTLQTYLDSQR